MKKMTYLFISLLLLTYSFKIQAQTFTQSAKDQIQLKLPAEILELNNWKLNVPEGIKTPGKSDEYRQPELKTYHNDNWFFVNKTEDAVVFRATTGGTTTIGSGYPRSELREMINDGKKKMHHGLHRQVHIRYLLNKALSISLQKNHI
ncbi:polysaccharide lyase family 7 protein [Pedobacter sp. NJ-S-72]